MASEHFYLFLELDVHYELLFWPNDYFKQSVQVFCTSMFCKWGDCTVQISTLSHDRQFGAKLMMPVL